jgi:hypothetical protein
MTLVNYLTITEYPNYQIGTDGSIWSRIMRTRHRIKNTKEIRGDWRRLQSVPHVTGYRVVSLYKDHKARSFRVHKLVMEAFVGPCPENMECRHLNGDREDNRLDNLCWGTAVENWADRISHGMDQKGEKNPLAKLNSQKVRDIRILYKSGLRLAQLSRDFKVTPQTIRDVCMRKTWTHIEDEPCGISPSDCPTE